MTSASSVPVAALQEGFGVSSIGAVETARMREDVLGSSPWWLPGNAWRAVGVLDAEPVVAALKMM